MNTLLLILVARTQQLDVKTKGNEFIKKKKKQKEMRTK
jgi:hypothetical protein